MDEKVLHLQTKRQALLEAQALVREYVSIGRSLSEELIAERREETRREEENSNEGQPSGTPGKTQVLKTPFGANAPNSAQDDNDRNRSKWPSGR